MASGGASQTSRSHIRCRACLGPSKVGDAYCIEQPIQKWTFVPPLINEGTETYMLIVGESKPSKRHALRSGQPPPKPVRSLSSRLVAFQPGSSYIEQCGTRYFDTTLWAHRGNARGSRLAVAENRFDDIRLPVGIGSRHSSRWLGVVACPQFQCSHRHVPSSGRSTDPAASAFGNGCLWNGQDHCGRPGEPLSAEAPSVVSR